MLMGSVHCWYKTTSIASISSKSSCIKIYIFKTNLNYED